MRRFPPPLEHGFTLIELMVTLGVLAIVMVASVPSFLDFFDKNRVRGAGDGVISLIGNARAEAVKNGLDVNVAMTGSGAAWCLGANAANTPTGGNPAGNAAPCDCTDAAQCLVGGQRSAIDLGTYPDVRVGALPSALVFDSKLGTLVPLGTRSFTLTSPRGKYDLTVELNALGQARLCVPTGKPPISGVPSC